MPRVTEITGPTVPEGPAAVPGVVTEDLEALFKEARRRRRRRRLAALTLGVFGVLLVALVYSLLTAPASSLRNRTRPRASTALSPIATTVALKAPAHLAVSANGTVYVIDATRDQILRRLRDGRFAVFAGSGREGYSGDGGPATHAALRLSPYSDITSGANGTIYFADTGNNRVRAVLPSGRIETIAGDGRGKVTGTWPPLTGSRPALRAELVNPTGLAFAPNGELYIAAQDIVALSRGGTISYFAGPSRSSQELTPQDYLVDGTPTGLAFDGAGDMFVSAWPWLAERTAAGQIRFLGNNFRAAGGPGILASTRDHTVFEAYGTDGILSRRLGSWPVPRGSIMSSRGVQSVIAPGLLDRPLGRVHGIPNGFAPDGLAIGPNGAIYTDTNSGDGWTTVSALVEIAPDGRVLTLWKS